MNKTFDTNTIYYKSFLGTGVSPTDVGKSITTKGLTKLFSAEAPDSERVIRYIGTTEDIDRDGEIVSVDGWDFENYKKNPVVLWMHNYQTLPVGKVVGIYKDKKAKQIYFDIYYAKGNPLSEQLFTLAQEGIISATSVGFRVKDWKYDEEKEAFVFLSQEMFEISLVTVPANPNATVAEGKTVEEDVEKSGEPSEDIEQLRKLVETLTERMEQIQSMLEAKPEPEQPAEPEAVEPEAEPSEPEQPAESEDTKSPEESSPEDMKEMLRELLREELARLQSQEEPAQDNGEGEVVPPEEEPKPEPEAEQVPAQEPEPQIVDVEELNSDEEFVIVE